MKISKKILAYRGILIMMLCMAFFVLGGSTAFAKWIPIKDAVSTYDTYFAKQWYDSNGARIWHTNSDDEIPEDVTLNIKLEDSDADANNEDPEDRIATKSNAKRTERTIDDDVVKISEADEWEYIYINENDSTLIKVEEEDIPGFKSEISFSKNPYKNLNEVIIKNTKIDTSTGDITISKTVSGAEPDMDKAFDFVIKLDDETINDTYGELEFVDGMSEFELKHNESVTATGLPEGVAYEVTEIGAEADGYSVTVKGGTGNIIGGKTVNVSFVNTKDAPEPEDPTPDDPTPDDPTPDKPNEEPKPDPEPKTGGLKVTKTVTGNAGDTNKDFSFTVTLSDKSISGSLGEMTFADGVAKFSLKHGESITASGIPADVTYTVAESDNAGYTVTKSGDTGTIKNGVTATAMFTNNRTTGGNGGGNNGGGGGGGSHGGGGGYDNNDPLRAYEPPVTSGNDEPEIETIIDPAPVPAAMPVNETPNMDQTSVLDNVPKTGDSTNVMLCLILAGASFAGAAGTFVLSGKRD